MLMSAFKSVTQFRGRLTSFPHRASVFWNKLTILLAVQPYPGLGFFPNPIVPLGESNEALR